MRPAGLLVRSARSSIGLAHKHARLERPDEDARIRMLERGIARKLGGREIGVSALLDHVLAQAVGALGHGPLAERDRALLVLGFASALRASDLAGLDIDCVRFTPQGVRIFLRRSKEDRLGKGTYSDGFAQVGQRLVLKEPPGFLPEDVRFSCVIARRG